ncbi:hypothetical protein J6590_001296 [Homalodisca vitripennis]|nr:hypothetical protein J6590_001296 [Homalodisca vitripennis]
MFPVSLQTRPRPSDTARSFSQSVVFGRLVSLTTQQRHGVRPLGRSTPGQDSQGGLESRRPHEKLPAPLEVSRKCFP